MESPEYVRELVTHHVGGYLKIAPEHTESGPLSKMMKPGMGSYDRFAEMLLLVEEAIGWIEDKPWKGRPSLGPQRVELQLGPALPVRPRLNQYRSNRREAMQLFMQDLEEALIAVMPDTSRQTATEP